MLFLSGRLLIVDSISEVGKDELVRRIKSFKGRFKMDFDDVFYERAGVDRLRHIYLAALVTGVGR